MLWLTGSLLFILAHWEIPAAQERHVHLFLMAAVILFVVQFAQYRRT